MIHGKGSQVNGYPKQFRSIFTTCSQQHIKSMARYMQNQILSGSQYANCPLINKTLRYQNLRQRCLPLLSPLLDSLDNFDQSISIISVSCQKANHLVRLWGCLGVVLPLSPHLLFRVTKLCGSSSVYTFLIEHRWNILAQS